MTERGCGLCDNSGGCTRRPVSASGQWKAIHHLNYHRPRSRPASPQPFCSRPTSPIQPSLGYQSMTGIVFQPPQQIQQQGFVTYPYLTRQEGPIGNTFIPVINQSPISYSPTIYGPLSPSSMETPNYFTGTPYMMVSTSANPSRAPSPQTSLLSDMEDLSLKSRWVPRGRGSFKRSSYSSGAAEGCRGLEGEVPPLRVSVSSLPSPQDAPGIPVQDTICPFHHQSSTWSDLSFSSLLYCSC